MVGFHIAGQADPAGHIHGVGGELQLQSAFAVLHDLVGVGVPGGAGIHVAGHHGGDHVGGVHFVGLDVVHGQAGGSQSALQSGLRGGAAVVGDLLALQVGDVVNGGDTGGRQDDDAVGAVDGGGQEDVGLAVDAQLVGAVADVSQIDAAAFHSGDLGGAVSELPQSDFNAFLGKVALVHGSQNGPQGSVVGHIGHVQLHGFHRGFGLGGSLGGGRSGSGFGGSGGGGGFGLSAAGGHGQDHSGCEQQGKQFLHKGSSIFSFPALVPVNSHYLRTSRNS